MIPSIYDFTIPQGTTVIRHFCLKDAHGLPVDLTGYAVRLTVRPRYGSKCAADELSSEDTPERMTVEAKAGRVKCLWPADMTAALALGRYSYALDLTSADGFSFRPISGQITIS